jgi:hypothetical protein
VYREWALWMVWFGLLWAAMQLVAALGRRLRKEPPPSRADYALAATAALLAAAYWSDRYALGALTKAAGGRPVSLGWSLAQLLPLFALVGTQWQAWADGHERHAAMRIFAVCGGVWLLDWGGLWVVGLRSAVPPHEYRAPLLVSLLLWGGALWSYWRCSRSSGLSSRAGTPEHTDGGGAR